MNFTAHVKTGLIGLGMIFAVVAPSQASIVTYEFSAGQIESAVSAAIPTVCGTNASTCGVYGFIVVPASVGAVSSIGDPLTSPADAAWNLVSTLELDEASGVADIQFITTATGTAGKTYKLPDGGKAQTGIAPVAASTEFTVSFNIAGTAPSTESVTLDAFVDEFTSVAAVEGIKVDTPAISVLATQLSPVTASTVPEPGTIATMLGGAFAIGLASIRRRRAAR